MKILLTAAVLLLSGCASGAAPPERGAPEPDPIQMMPSVFALLGERQALGLSSVQVESLDSIGEWITRRNSGLEERLAQLGVVGMTGPAGRRGAAIPDAAIPLLEEVRQNNEQALAGVGELLSQQQKLQVCESRDRPAPMGGRSARGRQPPPSPMGRDSLRLGRQAAWPWCGATPPAAP